MLVQFAKRMVTQVAPKALGKFAWNFGFKSLFALRRFKKRLKRGENFPLVLFISVTNRCNLRCQGCWVSVESPGESLPPDVLDNVIGQAKRRGNCFFGILGGEPLMYRQLWDVLARHGDCYFQVLTNGTLITGDVARTMRQLGNVTPLISIEGLEASSDVRRGGRDVYRRTLAGLEHCRASRLLIGVATSVCRSNIDELVTERFLGELIDRGVHYVWYYVYRPVGPRPGGELALTAEQILKLRQFIVEARRWAPLLIIDAYWDHDGRALCPAAAGISYHVNPWADVESCPPVQFAVDNAGDRRDVFDVINGSSFLRDFGRLARQTTRGCILMEAPDVLRAFLVSCGARDTSGRGSALMELAAACPRPSHGLAGGEMPERQWLYRLAKKHWFWGLGAYG